MRNASLRYSGARNCVFVLVEIGLQIGVARRADGGNRRLVDDEEGDLALLVLQTIERGDERLRNAQPGGERLGDLAAHELLLHIADEFVAVHAGIRQTNREKLAVEAAVRILEGRVLGDLRRDAVVGYAEPVTACGVVKRGVHENRGEHLLRIDLLAAALGGSLRVGKDVGEFLHRYLLAADARKRARAVALESADAPDGEAQDEQRHQELGDPALGTLTQLVEHEKASRA